MKKLLLATLFCGLSGYMHTAESMVAVQAGQGDLEKKAHAWTHKALKELPDKLDRLVLLNQVYKIGHNAHIKNNVWGARFRTDFGAYDLPEKTTHIIQTLVNELPEDVKHIQVYYKQLYNNVGIPHKCMFSFKTELPESIEESLPR